jgi:hypothetical protein
LTESVVFRGNQRGDGSLMGVSNPIIDLLTLLFRSALISLPAMLATQQSKMSLATRQYFRTNPVQN